MIFNRVCLGAGKFGGRFRIRPDVQWRCWPNSYGDFHQSSGSFTNGFFIPSRNLAEAVIQFEWALLETADHRLLFTKWPITVFGVVFGQCEIAQCMQPLTLDSLLF